MGSEHSPSNNDPEHPGDVPDPVPPPPTPSSGFAFAPRISRSSADVPKPTIPPPISSSGVPGLSVTDYLRASQEGVNLVAPRGPYGRGRQETADSQPVSTQPPPPAPAPAAPPALHQDFAAPPPPPEIQDTAESVLRSSRNSQPSMPLPTSARQDLAPLPVAGLPTLAYLPDEAPVVYKQEEITLGGVLGAAGAGAIGALVWAFLIWFLQMEFTYAAIGLGLGIGHASAYYGGRGIQNGIICACIAVVAMGAGRFIGYQTIIPSILIQLELQGAGGIEAYNALRGPAKRFANITTEQELREFVLNQGFTGAVHPDEIPQEQLDEFSKGRGQELLAFASNPIPFAEWDKIERQKAVARAKGRTVGLANRIDMFVVSIGPMDIILILFGIGSAFYIGKRRDGHI